MSADPSEFTQQPVIADPQRRRRGRPRKIPSTVTKLSGRPPGHRGAPRNDTDFESSVIIDAEFDDLSCAVAVLLRCSNQA